MCVCLCVCVCVCVCVCSGYMTFAQVSEGIIRSLDKETFDGEEEACFAWGGGSLFCLGRRKLVLLGEEEAGFAWLYASISKLLTAYILVLGPWKKRASMRRSYKHA